MRDALHKPNQALVGVMLSFAVMVLLVISYVAQNSFLAHLDSIAYRTLMTSKSSRPVDARIAIIDIDEKSLAKLGQWPWPRYILADLIQKLTQNGALAIGVDILQDAPDRNSPELIQKQLNERFGAKLNFGTLPQALLNHDRHFSEVISRSPVVIGMVAQFEGEPPEVLSPSVGIAEKTASGMISPRETILKAKTLIQPLPIFSEVAPVGTINVMINQSGFVDKIPLLFNVENQIYASLALRTLMRYEGKRSLRLQGTSDGLSEIGIASKISIPVETSSVFRPVFRGKAKSYPYYSAIDILENKVDPQWINGRILFVGTSAIGLADIKTSPYDSYFPGVEVHATMVDNFLNGESIRELPYTVGLQILAMLVIGSITMLVFWRFSAIVYVLVSLFLLGLCFFISYFAFNQGVFFSPVYVVLMILAMGIHILPIRFTLAEIKRREIKRAFSRYVAPEVVARLTENNEEPLLGIQKETTILFTDVLGFTTISEKLAPTQIVSLLNQYFTPMTECVKKNEGTLDKFIGDALMAFWNAPLDVKDHPIKAVKAAVEMQEQMARLRPLFQEKFGVEIKMGVGIHTGIVHVGNMGSEDLQDYTCIGDAVNLASRLEGMCRRYGVGIVVSSDTVGACDGQLHFRRLDTIRVKGKIRPSTIFTPIEINGASAIEKEHRWNEALDTYAYGRFEDATPLFEELLLQQPEYESLIQLYIHRCQELIKNPPEEWQGAWNYEEK